MFVSICLYEYMSKFWIILHMNHINKTHLIHHILACDFRAFPFPVFCIGRNSKISKPVLVIKTKFIRCFQTTYMCLLFPDMNTDPNSSFHSDCVVWTTLTTFPTQYNDFNCHREGWVQVTKPVSYTHLLQNLNHSLYKKSNIVSL